MLLWADVAAACAVVAAAVGSRAAIDAGIADGIDEWGVLGGGHWALQHGENVSDSSAFVTLHRDVSTLNDSHTSWPANSGNSNPIILHQGYAIWD